jgi:hypothetical protein
MAGLPILLRNRFDGTCIRRYPTKRILTDVCNEFGTHTRRLRVRDNIPDIVRRLASNPLLYRPILLQQYCSTPMSIRQHKYQ